MIDKRLYCETFSRLCASEEAKKEVFQMMNEKQSRRRFPRVLRTAAIAAVMTAALAVTAGAADLATGGEFFRSLRQVWTDGYETRYEAVDREGNEILLSVSEGARIETRDDGRTMVLCAAGEEVNITEKLAEDGRYHFERETESHSVSVDVTGSAEAWELTETVTGSNGASYTNRITSDGLDTNISVTTASEESGETDENGVTHSSTVTVTQNGVRDILVEDETKMSYASRIFTVEAAPSQAAED